MRNNIVGFLLNSFYCKTYKVRFITGHSVVNLGKIVLTTIRCLVSIIYSWNVVRIFYMCRIVIDLKSRDLVSWWERNLASIRADLVLKIIAYFHMHILLTILVNTHVI